MQHLLGLVFPKDSGRGIQSLRALTDGEQEEYQTAYGVLSRFFNRRPYLLMRQMHRQFIATYEKHQRRLAESGPLLHGDISFDINSRLALWLEASRLFLNHTETDLKRTYGESSEHWRRWKETKTRLFDDEVAYRFMYHLRNYLHVAMPVTDITLSSWEIEPGSVSSGLHVRFSRDELLAGKEWHAKVRSDLEAMPPQFAVMPLAVRFAECVEELMRTLIGLDLDTAMRAAQVIERLASEAMSAPDAAEFNAEPYVISDIRHDDTTGQLKISLRRIPASWPPLVRKAMAGEMTIFGTEDSDDGSPQPAPS